MGPAVPAAAPAGLRVMLVDDSAVVRRVLGDVVRRQPDLVLAGTATNGEEALSLVDELAPDVVVLDVEMPVLDGIGALKRLKQAHPKLPVVMFSTLTERGAAATVDALAAGADDYLTKPTAIAGPGGGFEAVVAKMLPLLRMWGSISYQRRHRVAQPPAQPRPPRRSPSGANRTGAQAVAAIVVGSSTGGPNALSAVVPALPAGLAVPVLVVQHMPPTFTKLLADRLDRSSALPVREVAGPGPLEPGCVYLAPGGMHLVVRGTVGAPRVELDDGPPENSCKPAVDVLMRSAAALWAGGVLGVVLTGMGQDGLAGSESIVSAGGRVVVQDEATSVVWGMPGAVARADLADEVLPLAEIAANLLRRVGAVKETERPGPAQQRPAWAVAQ